MIYLDNNASTRMCAPALQAMMPWLTEHWANPSSNHSEGRLCLAELTSARHVVAETFGASPSQIVFTSGATESNSLAILGAQVDGRLPSRFIFFQSGHFSVLTACERAALRSGNVDVLRLQHSEDPVAVLRQVGLRRGDFVSIDWVNNETGIINDVAAVSSLASFHGALVHVDAAQAPGKIDIDLSKVAADFVTLSAHKMHGPRGIGALVVRPELVFEPLWVGGAQESGRRGGTENVPGAVGFAAAAAELRAVDAAAREKMRRLQQEFEEAISERTGEVIVIGQHRRRAPNTSLVCWPGLSSATILRHLDEKGICASSGSACSSRSGGISHVLSALGISEPVARGAVRFSTSRDTTISEIDAATEIVVEVIRYLHS